MNKISNVQFKPLIHSVYVKPFTMHFTLNGIERTWDLLQIHDSVSVVIYNITREVLVFVKQFRPAVYYNSIPLALRNDKIDVSKYPADLGITIECCAGIVDKNLPLVDIAKEEILEECGYKVSSETLEKVGACRSGVGVTGSKQTMFYWRVTDNMKISDGGGIEDEFIEVIEMSVPDIQEYIAKDDVLSPASFMFGIYWFLKKQAKVTCVCI